MTNQEFWSQLNRLAKKEDIFDAVELIRQAYKEDLGVICACAHKNPDTVYQLYVNMDNEHPDSEGNRMLLCYTSWEMLRSDRTLPEPGELLPFRSVIDNALSKPVIGGLLFNRHSETRMIFVPKALLGDEDMYLSTIGSMLKKETNPFRLPLKTEKEENDDA